MVSDIECNLATQHLLVALLVDRLLQLPEFHLPEGEHKGIARVGDHAPPQADRAILGVRGQLEQIQIDFAVLEVCGHLDLRNLPGVLVESLGADIANVILEDHALVVEAKVVRLLEEFWQLVFQRNSINLVTFPKSPPSLHFLLSLRISATIVRLSAAKWNKVLLVKLEQESLAIFTLEPFGGEVALTLLPPPSEGEETAERCLIESPPIAGFLPSITVLFDVVDSSTDVDVASKRRT